MTVDRRTLTLGDVIEAALNRRTKAIHVALPGRIVKFDAATQLADVKPLLQETYDTEDGEESEPLPVVTHVPVQFPGAGNCVITFPVNVGDPCLLIFADRALEEWMQTGEDSEPADVRRHNLSDAVALLGVRSIPGKLPVFDTGRAFFGSAASGATGIGVAVKAGSVHLGVTPNVDATDAVALASLVLARLQAITDAFDGHSHGYLAPTGGSTPATTTGNPSLADPASVASTKVKAV